MLRLAGGSEREGGTRPRFGVIAEDHQPWVSLIGSHSGEIPVKLWEGLDSRYHFENTDVNIDGFAVAVDGPAAELGALDYPKGLRRPEQGSGGFPDRGTPEVGGPVLHEGLQRQHSGPGAVRECPSGHLPHNPRGIMDHRGQRRSFGRCTELDSGGGPQISCPGEDERLRRSQNDRARD